MNDQSRLWLAFVEQASEARRAHAEIKRLQESRSWRATAPLRWLMATLQPAPSLRPRLQAPGQPSPAASASFATLPSWLPPGLATAPPDTPRLLVDVTQLALEDLGAGVQRVTRRVLHELLAQPPPDLAVVPVRLASDGRHYAAHPFLESMYGLAPGSLGAGQRIEPRTGDAYLGLDFCREHSAALGTALAPMRAAGVPVALVVHDLLPLDHPAWFPAAVATDFSDWLAVLARHADVALCISEATRLALARHLGARGLGFEGRSTTVPLGADALALLQDVAALRVAPDARGRRVLMVGTVEPRKGHAEVLDAADRLWADGLDFELVIAGHQGWQVDTLSDRIKRHPQRGQRLHWIDCIDDAQLSHLYAGADLLVMASHGEGYGLPIGEAARAGCCLLLRDIAVFREVAGENALYFDSASSLEAALRGFVAKGVADFPDPLARAWPSWSESAQAMARELIETRRRG